MIKVNSAQCGAGKTRKWIYPIIKNLLLDNNKVLLVVPSIDLQMQYMESFAQHITVINNHNSEHVTQDIYKAINAKRKFICITQQAFIMMAITFRTRFNYHLIIDEVLDPYKLLKINFDVVSDYMPNFKFKKLFTLGNKEYFSDPDVDYTKDTSWHPLHLNGEVIDVPLLNTSTEWHDLLPYNKCSYMRYADYVDLCKQNKKQIVIMHELSDDIITDWRSVHIAAAAFEDTFMRYWMDYNNVEYEVVEQFETHTTKATFHKPDVEGFRWSKHKKNTYKEILDKYHKYVNENAKATPIVIRNNDELRTLKNEIRLSHNVHGMNLENRKDITDVSLETALIPDSNMRDFYKNELGMTDKQIAKAYSSYTFYQTILRSAVRDGIPVNVFALDEDTIEGLVSYFDDPDVIEAIDVSYTPMKKGRPKLSPEQVTANKKEYNRQYMANKRADKGHSL